MASDIFESQDSNNLDDLQQKVQDLQNQISSLNPRNMGGVRTKDLRQATRINFFGDGSDGNVILTSNTTLTRDMFYKSLTINKGVILKSANYRIFTTGDLINNGTIQCNGSDGANTRTAVPSGSLPAGANGGAGASAVVSGSNIGSAGSAGASVAKSLGAAGVGGGGGGSAFGNAGGSGGNGGSLTGTVFNVPRSPQSAYMLLDTYPSVTVLGGSAGAGGGGSGGAVNSGTSGAGGDGGAAGGTVEIFSYRIINNGIIQAKGNNGGNGGNAGTATGSGGGGGGGGGGAGGVIILVYGEKTGTGTTSVAGGTGGTGGTGFNSGANGSAGTNGNSGTVIEIALG